MPKTSPAVQANPLRIDDKPGSDTRYMVRSALIFMSEAFAALERGGDILSTGAMTGAAQLLNVCVDALKEEEKAEESGNTCLRAVSNEKGGAA